MSIVFLLTIILIILSGAIIYLLYNRKNLNSGNSDLHSRIDNMSNSLISHLSQQMDAMRKDVKKQSVTRLPIVKNS
ncbi:MAG: hypothetical protein AAB593_02450 [Patescibacteria group bacterium]